MPKLNDLSRNQKRVVEALRNGCRLFSKLGTFGSRRIFVFPAHDDGQLVRSLFPVHKSTLQALLRKRIIKHGEKGRRQDEYVLQPEFTEK